MVNLKDFKILIDELANIYRQEQENKERKSLERTNAFFELNDELRLLYDEERIRVARDYINPFVDENSYLNEKSSLMIIRKEYQETYHSLFLKYLWSSDTEMGPDALQSFLKEAGVDGEWVGSISKGSYSIKDEVYLKLSENSKVTGKRIDLLIVDNNKNWLVVIENKVNSEVHDDKDGRSQLKNYSEYIEKFKNYRSIEHKEKILLSYTEKNRNNSDIGWKYVDYYQLFRSLFPFKAQEAILDDYLKTLFKLLMFEDNWDINYGKGSLFRSLLFYKNVISKTQ